MRIAVTGLGLHTGLGRGVADTWRRVVEPAAAPTLTLHTPTGYARAEDLSFSAIDEAWQQAGLTAAEARTIGCTFSASKPLFTSDDEAVLSPGLLTDAVQARYGLGGESRTIVAACATGAYAVALAADWITQGVCDAVVTGSVEPRPHPLMAAGFQRMGVVSPDPVMRPFDRDRAGFVFGEGAGAIVLESEAHAAARGARPLAWLSGWARGADGHSAVAFNSGGARIADVIGKALAKARLAPTEIGHVNAHGTATRLNDALETQAIRRAFGPHASALKISATKSTTGHLLGAAGSVEFVLTVLALREQRVPPTAHLSVPDPVCDLDYTPRQAAAASFAHAASLSFGFGGPIGVLVASRC